MKLKEKRNVTFDGIGFTIQRAVMSIAKCTVPVNINWIQMSAFKCSNNKPLPPIKHLIGSGKEIVKTLKHSYYKSLTDSNQSVKIYE